MSPLSPRAALMDRFPSPPRSGWRTELVGRVLVVLMLVAVSLIGLSGAVAAAGGFDCQDVPPVSYTHLTLPTKA